MHSHELAAVFLGSLSLDEQQEAWRRGWANEWVDSDEQQRLQKEGVDNAYNPRGNADWPGGECVHLQHAYLAVAAAGEG